MTNKELLEDLLIEFDELGMEPTTIVPNPSERAIIWKRELMSAIEHWGAEVAREIFAEIEREITDALKSNYKVLPQVEESEALWNNVNGKIDALRGIGYFIDELKKKYTGG